jgi:hypothetical protein
MKPKKTEKERIEELRKRYAEFQQAKKLEQPKPESTTTATSEDQPK